MVSFAAMSLIVLQVPSSSSDRAQPPRRYVSTSGLGR
jgi:hypothetical protein